MRPKHMPTIKDVACQAGVSITTVSHVLHGRSHLYAETTVQRVLEASQALQYHPNSLARSLAQRRSHTLGIVIPPTAAGGFNMHQGCILSSIFAHASQHGYQIKLIPWQCKMWEAVIPTLEDASMDGVLLFITQKSSPLLTWACTTHLPCVAIGTLPKEIPLSCVDVDHESAIYEATRWLISLGHRRIGYIRGPGDYLETVLRERGYHRALEEAGLHATPAWTCDGNYSREAGAQGALRLTQACPALTALLCPNDRAAVGAVEALRKRGRHIPHEISVVGFNDREVAQYAYPPLTTIRKPMAEIGQKAVELLIRHIEGAEEESKPECVLLPAPLIARASVTSVLSGEEIARQSVGASA